MILSPDVAELLLAALRDRKTALAGEIASVESNQHMNPVEKGERLRDITDQTNLIDRAVQEVQTCRL